MEDRLKLKYWLVFSTQYLVQFAKPLQGTDAENDGEVQLETCPEVPLENLHESNHLNDRKDPDSDTDDSTMVSKIIYTHVENFIEDDDTRQPSNEIREDKPRFTHRFGSPGPPSESKGLDVSDLSVMGTKDSPLNMVEQRSDSESSIYHEDDSRWKATPTRNRSCFSRSMSTLSQDDMTMDAEMGRPPRSRPTGFIVQRRERQEERREERQEERREERQEERMKFIETYTEGREVPRMEVIGTQTERKKVSRQIERPNVTSTNYVELNKDLHKNVSSERKRMDADGDIKEFIRNLALSMRQPVPLKKQFDAAIVYDKSDYEVVRTFMDTLRQVSEEQIGEELRIELFDSEEFVQSKVMVVGDVVERCSVVFLYLTRNSNSEVFRLFCDEAVGLSRLGLNDTGGIFGTASKDRKWMLKPVHTEPQKSRQYQIPIGLLTLAGVDWYDWPSQHVRDRIIAILKTAINYRKCYEEEISIKLGYEHTFGQTSIFKQNHPSQTVPAGPRPSTSSAAVDAASSNAAPSLDRLARNPAQINQFTVPATYQAQTRQHNRYIQQPLPQQPLPQQPLPQQLLPQQQMPYRVGTPYQQQTNTIPHNNMIPDYPLYGGPMHAQGFVSQNIQEHGVRYAHPNHVPAPTTQQGIHMPLNPGSIMQDQLSYQFPNNGQNLPSVTKTPHGYCPQVTAYPPNQYSNQRQYMPNDVLYGTHTQNTQRSHTGLPNQAHVYKHPPAYNGQDLYYENQATQVPRHQRMPIRSDDTRVTSQSGAEYGSLMRDQRDDTPSSSDLKVVSRLTGKLITNPDLSNTDLEVDMNETMDTLSSHNPMAKHVGKGDDDDDSDDSSDDSDDSTDDVDLSGLISSKGRSFNIIGSSVVQLGKHNKAVEKYNTKHMYAGRSMEKRRTSKVKKIPETAFRPISPDEKMLDAKTVHVDSQTAMRSTDDRTMIVQKMPSRDSDSMDMQQSHSRTSPNLMVNNMTCHDFCKARLNISTIMLYGEDQRQALPPYEEKSNNTQTGNTLNQFGKSCFILNRWNSIEDNTASGIVTSLGQDKNVVTTQISEMITPEVAKAETEVTRDWHKEPEVTEDEMFGDGRNRFRTEGAPFAFSSYTSRICLPWKSGSADQDSVDKHDDID